MVAAGEAGGILDTILIRLAEFLEKNDAIVRKVKGAMIYPGVILSVAVIAISVLLIFVIPTFQNMFASVNLQLPLPTRIVIGASHTLTQYWWVIIGGIGAGIFALNRYYQTAPGRLQIDTMLLKTPVLGDVLRKAAVSRFTRTLGTLISSGVSILDGLEITARTAGNMVIHNAVMESRASIAGGETIAPPLAKSKVFPPMVISMISVGEQTGDMEEWARFSVAERDVLLRLTVLFQAAEESMTRDLLPLIMAVVREARLEEQLFLTTFLADEAKHTEFFRRVLDEICRQSGDLQRYQTPSFRRLFAERLPDAMHRLLADPSPAAQAEALVTYSLVGEGVLGDAGYHLFSTALARGDSMPGFREGLTHSQADEDRHMAYGLFVLSRLVAEAPEVWSAVSQRMEELLPLTLGIVSEFFEAYDPMPFGLSLDDTVQDAIARFASRWAALEGARAQGRALTGTVGAERTIRDVLG